MDEKQGSPKEIAELATNELDQVSGGGIIRKVYLCRFHPDCKMEFASRTEAEIHECTCPWNSAPTAAGPMQ